MCYFEGLWEIDINNRSSQVAYALLETLTEVLTRKLTIAFLSDIYKNEDTSYFEEIFSRKGAYKKTTNYFNKFFDALGREDIFDKIMEMLQNIDDPNKNPEKIVENLLNIVNERIKEKELSTQNIINILVGEKSLLDILK